MKSKRWLPRLLLLLLTAAFPTFAEKVATMPAPAGYIDDYAGVISSPAKADMEDLCRELHEKTKAQIFLVTIKTLDGEPVETFANELFAKWKIGEKKTDRGVLILFAINDHKRWIEVGYGLEGILPDARVGDIGRRMVPDLKQADYDGAVTTGLVQIANVIAADAKVSLQDAPAPGPESGPMPVRREPHHGASLIGILFRIIIIVLVLAFFGARGLFGFGLGWFMGGGGGRGGWGGGGGGGGGGDSGFGGFGGGESGGGGAGGDW